MSRPASHGPTRFCEGSRWHTAAASRGRHHPFTALTHPHASIIRFLEKRFGVKEPNISRYRRTVCGDLTSCFNFERPNNEPLPALAGRKTLLEADQLRAAQQRRKRPRYDVRAPPFAASSSSSAMLRMS